MGRLTVVSTQQGSLLVRKSIKASSSTLHAVNCMGRLNVASTQVGRKRHILPCGNAFRRAAVWHAFCPVKEPVLLASRACRSSFRSDPACRCLPGIRRASAKQLYGCLKRPVRHFARRVRHRTWLFEASRSHSPVCTQRVPLPRDASRRGGMGRMNVACSQTGLKMEASHPTTWQCGQRGPLACCLACFAPRLKTSRVAVDASKKFAARVVLSGCGCSRHIGLHDFLKRPAFCHSASAASRICWYPVCMHKGRLSTTASMTTCGVQASQPYVPTRTSSLPFRMRRRPCATLLSDWSVQKSLSILIGQLCN